MLNDQPTGTHSLPRVVILFFLLFYFAFFLQFFFLSLFLTFYYIMPLIHFNPFFNYIYG